MNIKQASQGFAAAGAEARLSVLKKLVKSGPRGLTVGELQQSLDIPPSTLAHHLRHLLEGGLIRQQKQGRQIINVPNLTRIQALAAFLLTECCSESETDNDCC